MPEKKADLRPISTELRKAGEVVGLTDRVYDLPGTSITFDEVLVKGDLSGLLDYNGKRLQITHVETMIGLLADGRGTRGPVWQGVRCEVAG